MSSTTSFTIRPIEPADDPSVAALIRTVMPEFGASGPGFAIHDPEVDGMSHVYRPELRAAYFVALVDGRIVAGGGVGPLPEADDDVCELKKMYALAAARGRGIGQALLDAALGAARTLGYRRCYLETLTGMDAARRLYEKNGFGKVSCSMGNTGHFGCDTFYSREL
jgi:putative acetyltransferase